MIKKVKKMPTEKAHLFIVTAPSGTGKTTLLKRLITETPNLNFSISHTTRPPREGETHGVDYFFTSVEEFHTLKDRGGFLEWAEVHGNFYGTSYAAVEEKLNTGIDMVLDIDVAGADQVRLKIQDSVSIFIFPPHPPLFTVLNVPSLNAAITLAGEVMGCWLFGYQATCRKIILTKILPNSMKLS